MRAALALPAVVLFAACAVQAQRTPDSTGAAVLAVDHAPDDSLSPRGALWRSLAVPGWGQLYVGRPVRGAVAVGAVGGLVGLTVYLNGRYATYRNAFLYVSRETTPDPTAPNPDNEFAAFFGDWIATGARSATATRQQRDAFRRNRDLAILGSVLAYALQALDAYVAAHLLDFDVSEDLTVRALPSPDGPAFSLVLRL